MAAVAAGPESEIHVESCEWCPEGMQKTWPRLLHHRQGPSRAAKRNGEIDLETKDDSGSREPFFPRDAKTGAILCIFQSAFAQNVHGRCVFKISDADDFM